MTDRFYGECSKKFQARELTIIKAYRNLTRQQAIPIDRDYWTLCGDMSDPSGELQPTCELSHVLYRGLIRDVSQFYGVERLPEVHEATSKIVRKSFGRGPKILLGELPVVMERALARGKLNPAIVNIDTLCEPTMAASLLGSVLDILSYVDGAIMVTLNVILEHRMRGRKHNFETLTRAMENDRFCKAQLNKGWLDSDFGVVYSGTGRSCTTMGTTVLYRPGRIISATG